MIDVHLDGGGFPGVPLFFGEGKAEEKCAFRGLAGIDGDVAEEWVCEQGFEGGEAGLFVGQLFFRCGLGGEDGAGRVGEGGGDVVQGDGDAGCVVDADGRGDEEGVRGLSRAEDDGVRSEDGVGGENAGVDVCDLNRGGGVEVKGKGGGDGQNCYGEKNGEGEGAAFGWGEGGI